MNMVQRVAMAIAEADLSDGPNDTTYDFFALTEEIADRYYRLARAAIEAMREPTPNMVQVVSANWGRRTWAEYNEVIDAALQEPTR